MATSMIKDFLNQNFHGITLKSIMPMPAPLGYSNMMPEMAIVAAARTSFLGEAGRLDKDQKLFNYLLNHDHSSPFEMSDILLQIDNDTLGDLSADNEYFKLITDSRWKLASVIDKYGSLLIRIDINNLISYIKQSNIIANGDHNEAFNEKSAFNKFIIKLLGVAYPWLASYLKMETVNEVDFLEIMEPLTFEIDPEVDVVEHGDRWVKLLDIGCSDQYLCELIQQIMEDAPADVEGAIQFMFESGDLRPLSLISIKYGIKAPVIFWWQMVRHRSWSFSLQSGRYMPFNEEDIYVPTHWRLQSESNKQGSSNENLGLEKQYELLKNTDLFESGVIELGQALNALHEQAFHLYNTSLQYGVAKEQARIFLPAWASLYLGVAKTDLMSLLRFLRLRLDEHAQYEIRQYADLMFKLWEVRMPITARIAKEFGFKGY